MHGFRVSHFSEGAGVIGLVTRLHLESDRGPDSLIAKFPLPGGGQPRPWPNSYDMYGREVRFLPEHRAGHQTAHTGLPLRPI